MGRIRLKECFPILQALIRVKGKKKRLVFLSLFEKCIDNAVQEMAYNTLHGNLPLNRKQIDSLRRYKKQLKSLANHSTSKHKRKNIIIQDGGFPGLIPILLNLVAPAIISKIIEK
jgi:hypothetical protein